MPALIAAIEALLMMEPPPWSFMYRAARWRASNDPEKVHVHDAGEILKVVGKKALERTADPGVVEHDVQAAEALHGKVHQRLDLFDVADVSLFEHRGIAELRDERPSCILHRCLQ